MINDIVNSIELVFLRPVAIYAAMSAVGYFSCVRDSLLNNPELTQRQHIEIAADQFRHIWSDKRFHLFAGGMVAVYYSDKLIKLLPQIINNF